jgi:5S rRNA maturation endonuclease (ribonuclease M5)
MFLHIIILTDLGGGGGDIKMNWCKHLENSNFFVNATLVCIIPKCQIFQVSMDLIGMYYAEIVLFWL